jgi:REP element-mobilizing transposase RayT
MKFNPDLHHRRSIRLKGYDYSRNSAYFVTMCSWERESIFGELVDGEMRLNYWGLIIDATWCWLGKQYPYLELEDYVVMPNHLHGILLFDRCKGGSRTAPTGKTKPLGQILGAFKTRSTKLVNEFRQTPGAPIWQRNYYERIIRNQGELNRMGDYIVSNPVNWIDDENNPTNVGIQDMIF